MARNAWRGKKAGGGFRSGSKWRNSHAMVEYKEKRPSRGWRKKRRKTKTTKEPKAECLAVPCGIQVRIRKRNGDYFSWVTTKKGSYRVKGQNKEFFYVREGEWTMEVSKKSLS